MNPTTSVNLVIVLIGILLSVSSFATVYILNGIKDSIKTLTDKTNEIVLDIEKLRSYMNLESLQKQSQIDNIRMKLETQRQAQI